MFASTDLRLQSVSQFHNGNFAYIYHNPKTFLFHIKIFNPLTHKLVAEFEPFQKNDTGNLRVILLSDNRILVHQPNSKALVFELKDNIYKCVLTSKLIINKIKTGDEKNFIAQYKYNNKDYLTDLDIKTLSPIKAYLLPAFLYWIVLPNSDIALFGSEIMQKAQAIFYKKSIETEPYKRISLNIDYAIDPVVFSQNIIGYKLYNKYMILNTETKKTWEIFHSTLLDLVFANLPDKQSLIYSYPNFYLLDQTTFILKQINLNLDKTDECTSLAVSPASGLIAATFYGQDKVVMIPMSSVLKEKVKPTLFNQAPATQSFVQQETKSLQIKTII